jgi:hypothetical protein
LGRHCAFRQTAGRQWLPSTKTMCIAVQCLQFASVGAHTHRVALLQRQGEIAAGSCPIPVRAHCVVVSPRSAAHPPTITYQVGDTARLAATTAHDSALREALRRAPLHKRAPRSCHVSAALWKRRCGCGTHDGRPSSPGTPGISLTSIVQNSERLHLKVWQLAETGGPVLTQPASPRCKQGLLCQFADAGSLHSASSAGGAYRVDFALVPCTTLDGRAC